MPEICAATLDQGWLDAIKAARSSRGHEVSPLIVAFGVSADEQPDDCSALRHALDEALVSSGRATVETVANTLFPNSLWNPRKTRQQLFERYLKILPTLRHLNRRGLYFERLINYPGKRGEAGMNQLNHVAATFKSGNHRRSALQAAVLDPASDLTDSRQQGFPCLQQIAFVPNHEDNTLTLTAFYPMQYLFERAYGNYLGLSRLGKFMAHEMRLRLEKVICIAAVAKLDVPVRVVEPLISKFGSSRVKSVTK